MTRRLQVEVLAGPSVGETYEHREETILVGRGSNCQLQVTSPHVSRQQCELSWQGDQLVLENLGTVNVTYLNDRPIERVYVQDGDLITFCDVALRVRIPRAAPAQQDPDRTVAFPKDQVPPGAPPGHPLPQPGHDATVVRSGPRGQDTHPPGPLDGLPPGPPPPRAGQPIPGALGTGMYGNLSGQHPAHAPAPPGMPPAPPPRSAPPPPPQGVMGTQKFPAGLHLGGMPGHPQPPPAQLGHDPRMQPPPGMPGPRPGMPGPPPGMPGGPPAMPGPPRGMQPPAGMPGPAGPAGHGPGAESVDRPRKKRKKKGKQSPNLPLIRNVVLVAAAIIVLLAFAFALTQPTDTSAKNDLPTATDVPDETPAPIVKSPDDPRTDEEIVQEGQKLYGTGSTYLREYRIADENLWTAKEYMERARDELRIVPSEKWPPFAVEIDQKLAETEGLLDQEFRRLKLAYVREKSAGNYDRAMEELERLQRIFPSKEDERHQFARKQKKALNNLMNGGGGSGIFGGR